MTVGRKPQPTAFRRAQGNPSKRAYNHAEPIIGGDLPDCPSHLSVEAKGEWARLAGPLHAAGILTLADRAALAAYCQCYARWVEAEERLAATPTMLKTPSGYVQQSPWLAVANKQLELMGRYMAELGLTPAARSRIAVVTPPRLEDRVTRIELVAGRENRNGNRLERPFPDPSPGAFLEQPVDQGASVRQIQLDGDL